MVRESPGYNSEHGQQNSGNNSECGQGNSGNNSERGHGKSGNHFERIQGKSGNNNGLRKTACRLYHQAQSDFRKLLQELTENSQ